MKKAGIVRCIGYLAFAGLAGICFAVPPSAPVLKFAVIVTRHGVRAPTWTSDRLNAYSSNHWPDWGVPPAYLTARGRTLMKVMGAYYRDWFAAEGLLHRTGCNDQKRIYIWADTDQRTLETGRALAEGLLAGCKLAIHSLPEGQTDPLFDPIEAGVAQPDTKIAAEAIRKRIGPDPRKLFETHKGAFEALARILSPSASSARPLVESEVPVVNRRGKSVELVGPFSPATTLSENLLLEYANGFKGSELAWGRLTEATLYQILELHTIYADLTRRTPYLAQAGASNLLSHILRSIQQAGSGSAVQGALGQSGTAVVVLSGHDTNLSNISGMLGMSWKLPGYQTDDTPPGGALVFTLWQDSQAHSKFIRTYYLAQSLDQMREATPLSKSSPPLSQELAIGDCPAPPAGCPLPVFEKNLQRAIVPEFTSLKP